MSKDIDVILIDKYSNFTALVDEDGNLSLKNGLSIDLDGEISGDVRETKSYKMAEKMIDQMIKLKK